MEQVGKSEVEQNQGGAGLTAFIVQMLKTPVATLTRASPAKLAAKYGIPEDTARFQIDAWVSSPYSNHRGK